MKTRTLKYVDGLSEATVRAMDEDSSIFITGLAVDYSSGIYGSTVEAFKKFGSSRVFDSPAMENALTGIAIGAAAMGKRPVIVHPRADFMFLAFDAILNLAAKWRYMYGGNAGHVPIVVRAIIGKGWGQGATHSQSLHSLLGHFPGLHVALPATPRSAYELTYSALTGNTPTVILEHRSLYNVEQEVPSDLGAAAVGKAEILREGTDITIVAASLMVQESLRAADELALQGISVEVIDPRWIRPLDEDTILKSVRKTGRLLATDISWEQYGFASEVCALVAEKAFTSLKGPVRRICVADTPAPVSLPLETAFYPRADTIAAAVSVMTGRATRDFAHLIAADDFKGPY